MLGGALGPLPLSRLCPVPRLFPLKPASMLRSFPHMLTVPLGLQPHPLPTDLHLCPLPSCTPHTHTHTHREARGPHPRALHKKPPRDTFAQQMNGFTCELLTFPVPVGSESQTQQGRPHLSLCQRPQPCSPQCLLVAAFPSPVGLSYRLESLTPFLHVLIRDRAVSQLVLFSELLIQLSKRFLGFPCARPSTELWGPETRRITRHFERTSGA